MPDDDPPETPPAVPGPIPSVATVSRQVSGLAGQLHGARNDIDSLGESLRRVADDVSALRRRLVDEPTLAAAGIALAPEARPSMAVQAAQKAGAFGKYSLLVIGGLGVLAQVAAQFRPGLVGPLQVLIQLLGGTP